MNLSLIEKFGIVFKYIFSSFLSIELFILSLLLFLILIFNVKRNRLFVQMLAIGVYIGFVLGILISYTTYVKTSVNSFVKTIMNYIYFPSTVVYFFIMLFVTIMILTTLFSKRLNSFKKIVNYSFFSLLYFFFMAFITLCAYDNVDMIDTAVLYQNNVILSIVQISNFILLLWILFTCFYNLFQYFKKKYD